MEGLGGVWCDCRRWVGWRDWEVSGVIVAGGWRDWEVSGVIVAGGWGGGTGRCLV